MIDITPTDRAKAIVSRMANHGGVVCADPKALEQMITEAIQAESNAQLMRCRERNGKVNIKMQRIHPAAILPTRKDGDAGYDLYAVEPMVVPAGGFAQLRIGWNIEIPWGWWAKIECRSGLASKGFFTTGGVLDPSYRGEPKVFMHWLRPKDLDGTGPHFFAVGDRIAQMLILPVFAGGIEEVAELSETERGDKGFGSTGR